MRRLLPALLALLLFLVPAAEGRRRAVRVPENPIDAGTPAGWLYANARVLESTSLISPTDDLAPLRTLAASASVVGLGDLTHGTREVQTVKLRMIDVLVRDLGFDVVALEAPFPIMNRLNSYVQGGGGDPRALLREAEELFYTFWNTEELLEVVEWMRAYNANRRNRPAIELAGADVNDELSAAAAVVTYLEGVDPAAAQQAQADYECVRRGRPFLSPCAPPVARVRAALAAKEAQYTATTSARAFHDALQYATVVSQTVHSIRDSSMAENVLWMRQHRGTSGKVVFWAHNEHVTEGHTRNPAVAGVLLASALGDGYVTVATMATRGTLVAWKAAPQTRPVRVFATLTEPQPGSYESFFRQRGASILFIPLRGVSIPAWLAGPAPYRWAGVDGTSNVSRISLPAHFDAVVYIEDTTPLRTL